jgi:hypothetical protein
MPKTHATAGKGRSQGDLFVDRLGAFVAQGIRATVAAEEAICDAEKHLRVPAAPPGRTHGGYRIPGLSAGAELRDKGLAQVAENAEPWFARARRYVEKRAVAGRLGTFTGEFLRDVVTLHVGEPHHSNAWGALTSRLVKDGTIVPTGQMVPSQRKTSHAHRTPEYRAGGRT